jgi:hypothetical protein
MWASIPGDCKALQQKLEKYESTKLMAEGGEPFLEAESLWCQKSVARLFAAKAVGDEQGMYRPILI